MSEPLIHDLTGPLVEIMRKYHCQTFVISTDENGSITNMFQLSRGKGLSSKYYFSVDKDGHSEFIKSDPSKDV